MVKVSPLHRVYDAKLPRKERSATVSSLRNIHSGSVKSLQFEAKNRVQINQPATSREARPKQRVNLPPKPSTSRTRKQPSAENDSGSDDDAASEPDLKMGRGRENATTKSAKQVALNTADKKPPNKACEI
ncbi:hypothetical protein M3Y97_00857300 [Aphelenchoides bicaudatus]|nr:hypothetical protein M3Y97_00857300 [Aphelenchoides bicaudatus]